MTDDSTKTAGIDTGKKRLALGFWPRGERYMFDNKSEGFAKICVILKAARVKRVGIESTSSACRHLLPAGNAWRRRLSVIFVIPDKRSADPVSMP